MHDLTFEYIAVIVWYSKNKFDTFTFTSSLTKLHSIINKHY